MPRGTGILISKTRFCFYSSKFRLESQYKKYVIEKCEFAVT